MKKLLLSILCSVGLFVVTACSDSADELNDDKIYFFYQTTCPHCHDAAQYIKANYPTLNKITSIDIKLPGNMRLFEKAVKKYKITGAKGTPLILMGDKYIMGWSETKQDEFDLYVKPYLE